MFYITGFPHSDIFGSKVARHLPEEYRRHATSFIAFSSQGIHHTPFKFPIRKFKNRLLLTLLTYLFDIQFSMCQSSWKEKTAWKRLRGTPYKECAYGRHDIRLILLFILSTDKYTHGWKDVNGEKSIKSKVHKAGLERHDFMDFMTLWTFD